METGEVWSRLIHPTAEVLTDHIGKGTRIWQYTVVLSGAKIGDDCNVCSHCFIEDDVIIGDRVTIKSSVQLWNGVRIEDDVFIGPNVSLANDKYPRSKDYSRQFLKTTVKRGASIGAGAVLLPGVIIGENSMVGAGAVVTKSVSPSMVVAGNPVRRLSTY